MTRAGRIAASGLALACAGATVVVLTAFSAGTEGPLAATLARAASFVDSLEYLVRERISGPGRRRELEWFEERRLNLDWLRHPDVILLGAFDGRLPDTIEGVHALEQAIGTTFPLVQMYSAWGDQPEQQFPWRVLTSTWNMGSVPVVTWEPWLSAFESARHPMLPLPDARDAHGLAAVARGDYDFYVDRWAADAARFERPLFLRFAHEMNDPYRYPWGPQHNTKEEFIAAWRHVVDRFRQAGADNVIWVWSPHIAYEYWELYYPGDDVVDWSATGVLNYGPIAQWSRWWSFDEILGDKYPRLAAFGKPIMIAEMGSLAVGGDREAWYREALSDLPSRFAAVKAVLFFHVVSDRTVTYQAVDWSIVGDAALARVIADALPR